MRFVMPLMDISSQVESDTNLINLKGSEATAYKLPSGQIFCQPELLCDLGCETPRIYYEEYLGKSYQFFYAISSDVDLENPGTVSSRNYFFVS